MRLAGRLLIVAQTIVVVYALLMHIFADHHDVLIGAARVGMVGEDPLDKEALALRLNKAVSLLLIKSKSTFGGSHIHTIKNFLWDDSLETFIEGGSCGNAAQLLAELLINAGVDARISQMNCGRQRSCHVLVEADVGYGDVVLDPLYGFAFRKPDGRLASVEEIQSNWGFYGKQVPLGYGRDYRFEGVVHTNWQKIPVILPLVKRVLDITLGKRNADRISLRVYLLNPYRVHEVVAIVLFLLIGLIELIIAGSLKNDSALTTKTDSVSAG